MAEYLTQGGLRRGGVLSTIIYYFMQVAIATVSIVVTAMSGMWIFGILLVLASKWRVFAVNPKYWWMNIKANLVDMTVRVGFVMLAYFAGVELMPAHAVLASLYVIWLLFVKPQSGSVAAEVQSLCAVFLGMTVFVTSAILMGESGMSLDLTMSFVVVVSFIVGYGSLRHILSQSEDYQFDLVTLGWGLLFAQMSWVLYHRVILYYLGSVIVPQMAVILTLGSFLFFRVYKSLVQHGGKVALKDVLAPLVFVVLVIGVILIFFSDQRFSY